MNDVNKHFDNLDKL